MANTRGVFTLQEVRYSIEDEAWVTPDEVFSSDITSSPNVGYYAGGTTPSAVSSIDKCNFSSDTTALLPGINLPSTNETHGSFSNINNGYFLGGRTPSYDSSVVKISYQNETVSKSPASALSEARQDTRGFANQSHGYATGGYNGSAYTSVVDKFIFAVETAYRFPGSSLITQRNVHGSIGNQDNGYLTNGYNGSAYISSCDRIVFASDTTSRIPATFPATRGGVTGASTDTIGYISGGVSSGPIFYSTMNKFTYSTETQSDVTSTGALPALVQNNGGAAISSFGYFGGGRGSGPAISTMCKINTSNDTMTNVPGANLTATRYNYSAVTPRGAARPTTGYVASTQNLKGQPQGPNNGYFVGGTNGPVSTQYSLVDKIFFESNTTGRVPATNLTKNTRSTIGAGSPSRGYTFGGLIPGPTVYSTTERITYSTETYTAVPGAALSSARYATSASGTNDFAYVATAYYPSYNSTTDKVVYSSETTAAAPALNITPNRSNAAGTGNDSAGYFTGGNPYSNTFRITYSSETLSQAPSANLAQYAYYLQASGDENNGYIAGGTQGPTYFSYIDKLNYSTNTISRSTATLRGSRYLCGATGNNSNGYFGGGYPNYSAVDRVDYATDTGFALPAANLTVERWILSGIGARDFGRNKRPAPTPTLDVSYTQITTPFTGYTAGGGGPAGGRTSNYYKLLYATETGSFLPSTNLTSDRSNYLGGYSDTTKGYTAGGYFGSPFFVAESWVDRVTYSTDTSVTVPGAYLPSPGRYGGTSGSSPSAGYYVAGFNTGALSTTLKMPFSSETHSTLPSSANLSSARYYFCGGGGPDKGYFGGGYPTTTKMDKLIYSTDTMTASPSTNLFGASDSTTRGAGAIVGNSRDAYLATGQNPGSPAPVPNYGYKINYSTDTSIIINGFVARPRQSVAGAFGHELQGYFCGGIVPSPYEAVTTVDKITYATEVSQLVPSASMPDHRSSGSNMSARNFGASGGGTSNIL